MFVYIFEDVSELTDRYHDGGGLVIIANNRKQAKKLAENYIEPVPWGSKNCYIKLSDEDLANVKVYSLNPDRAHKEKVFVFPDAGCC